MFLLCKQASKKNNNVLVCFAIFIYAVVFGVRYGVGVDYFTYLQEYMYMIKSPIALLESNFEIGFLTFIRVLSKFEAHFSLFFGIIAFVQLYLIFRAVNKTPKIYPYLVYTFMIGCVWLSFANGLRQELAFCFFAFSLSFVEDKRYILHYLLLAFAISMHNSAIILLPFYFILQYKNNWFKNTNLQLIALFLSVIVGNLNVIEYFLTHFESLFYYFNYDTYLDDKYSDKMLNLDIQKGIGYYVLLLTDIFLIKYSNNCKKYFDKSNYVTTIYNFYFVGVLIKYVFFNSHLIQRINYYFYGFYFIFAAYLLYSLHKTNKKVFFVLAFLFLLTFVGTLSKMNDNTSLFRFYWEYI